MDPFDIDQIDDGELLERLRVAARFQGQRIQFGPRWVEYLQQLTTDELLDLKLAIRAALV